MIAIMVLINMVIIMMELLVEYYNFICNLKALRILLRLVVQSITGLSQDNGKL